MHEIDKTKLTDQKKFRLYEIKKIGNCFINDINQQKEYSKKLNKYVTIFDYIDKILIVLSATTGGISIFSFTTAIGASVGTVKVGTVTVKVGTVNDVKVYREYKFDEDVVKHRGDLDDAAKVILEINKVLNSDKANNDDDNDDYDDLI